MRGLIDVSKNWEGRIVNGKFPLRQWLGGSDHSAVFLTEWNADGLQKAAIKIIFVESLTAENLKEEVQLSRWADAAKLSHPHLLRLFEFGRCQIDDARFLYVVMEYAEENLGQILPERALSPAEVAEMLPPVAQALDFLHRQGFAHGHIKPSNIMAVENQLNISAASLRKIGERDGQAPSAYIAPEVSSTGSTPEADAWSVGVMLVAIMTQHEPQTINTQGGGVAISDKIPQPFYGKAQQCLRFDPRQRCTMKEILGEVEVQNPPAAPEVEKPRLEKPGLENTGLEKNKKRWIVIAIVAVLFLAVLLGRRMMVQPPAIPPTESRPTEPQSSAASQPPAPFNDSKPVQSGMTRGSVLHQVLPDVSRQAQSTIEGHVKVSVQVSVDASGNVAQAKFVSPVKSQYFANLALATALRWKFNPPQVDGQAAPSTWVLRFQFGRTSTQVFPTETKP
jgi:TonB family protein